MRLAGLTQGAEERYQKLRGHAIVLLVRLHAAPLFCCNLVCCNLVPYPEAPP
jgi:hypothetical protein